MPPHLGATEPRPAGAVTSALGHLLRGDPRIPAVSSLAAFYERLVACPFTGSLERALWAGFEADRLGYAFVGGYQAALERLLGSSGAKPTRLSLAATETGGGHPRAIQTRVTSAEKGGEATLRGEKTFATLASAADAILVVASRGEGPDGKPQLVLVRVAAKAQGVVIEDRKALPFAPEIPHAKVTLNDVAVSAADVLPGDGYAQYLKPFRTFEDGHVLAAALGHVIRLVREHDLSRAIAESAVALASALASVDTREPLDPVGHIALRGIFESARALLVASDSEWDKSPADVRDRLRRDLPLLVVAESVRQKRTDAAWQALGEK